MLYIVLLYIHYLKKPIELLVLVSSMYYYTYTSNLSTWWSTTTLMEKINLKEGFPLRCFQRLS